MKKYVVLLLIIAFLCASGCITLSSTPVKSQSGPETFTEKSFLFTYNGNQYNIGVNVSSYQIEESQRAKEKIGDYNKTDDAVYFPAVIKDTKEDSLYEDILYDARFYKQSQNLDSNEYVGFLTAFVQSIPYDYQDDRLDPKAPIESIVDGKGDCDDKTVLLGGLLYKEGYAVSAIHLHLSGKVDHMGLGIRSNGADFDRTGYMFIEVTNITSLGYASYSYYGTPFVSYPDEDGDYAIEPPSVYVINKDGIQYTDGDRVEYDMSIINSMRSQFDCWNAQLDKGDGITDELVNSVDIYETQVNNYERQYKAGTISYCTYSYAYDSYEYNYDRAEDALKKYNTIIEERNRWRDLYNYLIDNTDSITVQNTRAHEWGDVKGTSEISYCEDIWRTELYPPAYVPKPCFEW